MGQLPKCTFRVRLDLVSLAGCNRGPSPTAIMGIGQGIGIKGREMALVWHEKAGRTVLQTNAVLHTHTLLVQTHNINTVKQIAEKCCQF